MSIDVRNAKMSDVAHLPAIASLIFKLQRVYGDASVDVFENIIRGSAICFSSGGSGEGHSMLTTLRDDLQEVADRRTPVSYLPGFERDDRCQDLLKDLWEMLLQLRKRVDQVEEQERFAVILATNEALHKAWAWKWGETELALIPVCQQVRIVCDTPPRSVSQRDVQRFSR